MVSTPKQNSEFYKKTKFKIWLSCFSLILLLCGIKVYSVAKTVISETPPSIATSISIIEHPTSTNYQRIFINEQSEIRALDAVSYLMTEDKVKLPSSFLVNILVGKNKYYLIITQNGEDIFREELEGSISLQVDDFNLEDEYRLYILNTETIPLDFRINVVQK